MPYEQCSGALADRLRMRRLEQGPLIEDATAENAAAEDEALEWPWGHNAAEPGAAAVPATANAAGSEGALFHWLGGGGPAPPPPIAPPPLTGTPRPQDPRTRHRQREPQ